MNRKTNLFGREEVRQDLRRKSVRSAAIRVIGNSSSALMILGSTIILARLLTPDDFGMFAMVIAITNFARSFVELGLGTATVQREEITHEEVSALFWINIAIGLLLTILVAGVSPAVAWFYNEPRLLNVCVALSPIFLLSGLTVQHRSLLERQMRYGYLAFTYFVSNFLGIAVAVALAMYGFGVWSLVGREVVYAVLYAFGNWILCGWVPGLPRLNVGIRSSLKFGADLAGVGIVQYLMGNLDKVIIGRVCGAMSLGLYTRAAQLVSTPISHVQMTITSVGLSPLSALQSEPLKYRKYYSKLLSILSFIYIPILAFLVVQSKVVVLLLLGEQWLEAVPFFRIFAFAVFVGPILSTCQLVMITFGKSRRYFLLSMVNSGFMVVAYLVGIFWGALGVASAYTIASYILAVPFLWYGFKDTPIDGLLVLKIIIMPVVTAACACMILSLVLPLIGDSRLVVNLISSTLVFSLVYFFVWPCLPGGKAKLKEFWSYRSELLIRRR